MTKSRPGSGRPPNGGDRSPHSVHALIQRAVNTAIMIPDEDAGRTGLDEMIRSAWQARNGQRIAELESNS